jgi:hypothetical protein
VERLGLDYFGIFHGHLVFTAVTWYGHFGILCGHLVCSYYFGMLHQKIWQPCCGDRLVGNILNIFQKNKEKCRSAKQRPCEDLMRGDVHFRVLSFDSESAKAEAKKKRTLKLEIEIVETELH